MNEVEDIRLTGRHIHQPNPGIFCSLLSSIFSPLLSFASIFPLPSSIFHLPSHPVYQTPRPLPFLLGIINSPRRMVQKSSERFLLLRYL